jgi:hypothetical protein
VSTKYLLPCPCGKKTPVERRQAGQAIRCSCGAELEVPTLLEMNALEPMEEAAPPPEPVVRWGARGRLILIGLGVLLLTAPAAVYIMSTWPQPPTRTMIGRQIDNLSPRGVRQLWRDLRREGLDPDVPPESPALAARVLWYRLWLVAVLLLLAVGIGLVVVPTLIPRRRQPPGDGPA